MWRFKFFSPNSFTVGVLNAVLSVSALAGMLCPPPWSCLCLVPALSLSESTSNVLMVLGQQVFAKYRPKSRNFKPATIVGIHDGNVDLRFDGYDFVRIPILQIWQIH